MSLKGIRNRPTKAARHPRPPTKPICIIHRIYLFHIFRFCGYADVLRITHLLRNIGIIRGCRHTRSWICQGWAFVIWNANIVVLIIDNGRIAACVILDEGVIDSVYITTGETHPVCCSISWGSHISYR